DLDAFLLEQIEEGALSRHDGQDVLPGLGGQCWCIATPQLPPTSALEQQPRLRSHIIERRCAASEGWREQEGRGFRRRGQDAKRAPGEGSISRLDQKNYATPKPIVAKITRLIE